MTPCKQRYSVYVIARIFLSFSVYFSRSCSSIGSLVGSIVNYVVHARVELPCDNYRKHVVFRI